MKKLKQEPQAGENIEVVGVDETSNLDNAVEVGVQNLETNQMVNEDPFAKGRERIAAIGSFFKNTKQNISGWFSRAGKTVSNFSSRVVNFGGEAVAATLSADVLAKKGYNVVSEKAGEAKEYVSQKGTEALEFAGGKVDQFGEWVDSKGQQIGNWANKKGEQVSNFAMEKAQLTKDAALYAKDKTVEGLTNVKNSVVKRYFGLKAWGENSYAAAKQEATRIKNAYNQRMNEIKVARLQAEYQKITEKEIAATGKVEKLRLQREGLEDKLAIIMGLESAA